MPNQHASANGCKWRHYNIWRSANRQLDKERRRERLELRRAAYVDGYHVPAVKKPRVKSFATVTVRLRTGKQLRFKIHELPHRLTVSPTLAGRRVQQILLAAKRSP